VVRALRAAMETLCSGGEGRSTAEPAAEDERRSAVASAAGDAITPTETAVLGAAGAAAASDDGGTDSDDSGTDSDDSGPDSDDDGTEDVRRLLALGADPTLRDADGDTAYHHAAAGGKFAMLEALLEATEAAAPEGADGARWAKMAADARGRDLRTPLHAAAEGGHVLAVCMLLAAGVSVDAADVNGRTPLHLATDQGHCEVAKVLLGEGAAVDAPDKNTRMPLDAAASGHAPLVRLLLEKGADPLRRDAAEGTSVVHAVRGGDRETLQRVAAGNTDEAKQLLLVAAAKGGSARAIKALVVAGASSREPVLRLAFESAANADVVWALGDVDPSNFRQAAEAALLPLATAGNVTALKAVIATGVEFSQRAFENLARAIEDNSKI
ncbi:Uncharacterized protein GBIM_15465, partial [Gryllus bimaculatus]